MTTTAQASATAPGSTAHTDGGWDLVPVQTRSERPRSYEPSAFGAPTGREVNWKHSPIAAVAPLFADESDTTDAYAAAGTRNTQRDAGGKQVFEGVESMWSAVRTGRSRRAAATT